MSRVQKFKLHEKTQMISHAALVYLYFFLFTKELIFLQMRYTSLRKSEFVNNEFTDILRKVDRKRVSEVIK